MSQTTGTGERLTGSSQEAECLFRQSFPNGHQTTPNPDPVQHLEANLDIFKYLIHNSPKQPVPHPDVMALYGACLLSAAAQFPDHPGKPSMALLLITKCIRDAPKWEAGEPAVNLAPLPDASSQSSRDPAVAEQYYQSLSPLGQRRVLPALEWVRLLSKAEPRYSAALETCWNCVFRRPRVPGPSAPGLTPPTMAAAMAVKAADLLVESADLLLQQMHSQREVSRAPLTLFPVNEDLVLIEPS
jgi:hypothetical protein